MKSERGVRKIESLLPRTATLVFLAGIAGWAAIQQIEAATNVVLWDTGAPLAANTEAESRAGWKAVPSELFVFEPDPAKAASDPGYYGREYSFKGDAVVENHNLAAVFSSAKGRVVIYSKADGEKKLGNRILEFVPLQSKSQPGKISRCEILRNAADEIIIEAFFTANGSVDTSAIFSFGKTEIVEIKPATKMKGISLLSPIEYGVVPGFIGDDLIFGSAEFASADTLSIPSENVFLGLLNGESSELVMAWPKGKQQLNLRLANDPRGKRAIESIDFDNDGQNFYLAALSAPGVWHKEELKPAYLEKDVALTWKKPFAAKWKTQLSEAGVKTTFAFRESKGTVWRGVPGSYNYPAWFDGETAFFHLSKKVPPKGESLIYFLEGQDTPLAVFTPVDVVKATLGRQLSDSLLDPLGHKLRTHHRRGGDGVHRACTCGCTEAIQAVFEKGQEAAKKDDVKEALGDMTFFVDCHVERIAEYQRFAEGMIQFLKAKAAATPELKTYLESLEQTVQQISQEYSVQKENMKSPEHMAELTRKTMALTSSKATNNLASYMELLKAWRAMGGAQDYVVAQCHTITRKLFQEAGYGCVNDSKAVSVAQEIRARCRQVLRNPDGYEIWANY
jgi:IS1 family transposase